MQQNHFALILAGGVGSRFWPKSTSRFPKQFHDILGTGLSLLQMTYNRVKCFVPEDNILISTSEQYVSLVKEQLPNLPHKNILTEPARRNTAPAIAYGMFKIFKRNSAASVVVCPSDHLITKEELFCEHSKKILLHCENNDCLVTMGITPHAPHTGYGYIQHIEGGEGELTKVKTFTEKPDENMARQFLESGDFLWNAGIFYWSVSTFLQALESHIPDLNDSMKEHLDDFDEANEESVVRSFYPRLENESIDYALMEKARNVFVFPADIGWSDLGAWGSLYEQITPDDNRNVCIGKNVLMYDSTNNLVHIDGDKTAVIEGLEGFIVVDTPNALLVCRKQSEQRVRDFVKDVKIKQGERFV
ncbi:MAG: mannose-1-phosphate guanylyltransferase [Cryomorphaceae bacterium]|nr:mannose-1-phosphate guanylyltransferase [Cryomorphaceae bacterium]